MSIENMILNRYRSSIYNFAEQKMQDRGYNNFDDLNKVLGEYCKNAVQQLISKRNEKEKAEEFAKLNELRNDGNFKEIPKEIEEKFLEIGITIKINMKESYLPGFRGRRGTTYTPFARYFLQDKNGTAGVLYNRKEIIKSVYDGSYTKDWEIDGSWWHVPSSVDLENLYSSLTQ